MQITAFHNWCGICRHAMEALNVLLTGCSATLMTLILRLLLSVVLLPQKQPPPLKVSLDL